MVIVCPHLSIMTLNVNILNSQIKGREYMNGSKKQDSEMYCYLQRDSFKFKRPNIG